MKPKNIKIKSNPLIDEPQGLLARTTTLYKASAKRPEGISKELWQDILELNPFEGVYALVSEYENDIFQEYNPNELRKTAINLKWEDFLIIDLVHLDTIENSPKLRWEIYPDMLKVDLLIEHANLKDLNLSKTLEEIRGRHLI